MNQKEEIPCTTCHLWNAKAKSFSCNPNSCNKLSRWLLERTPKLNMDKVQISGAQMEYVV